MQERDSETIELFAQAVEIESADKRKAFLDERCGDNRKLRGDVERLLAAHYSSRSLFLRLAFTLETLRSKYWPRINVRKAMAGLLVVSVIAVVIFYFQTNRGTLTITNRDPYTRVTLNGRSVSLAPDKGNDRQAGRAVLKVWAGAYRLHVQKGDLEFETETFHVKRGEEIRISIHTLRGQLRASIGRLVIGMAPRPEPTGPVAIQVPAGTFWQGSANKDPLLINAKTVGERETFTLEWLNDDHTEGFIKTRDGLYVSRTSTGDFVTLDERTEASLFDFAWYDREEKTFRLFDSNKIYVMAKAGSRHLSLGGSLGDLFRLVSPSDVPMIDTERETPLTTGLRQLRRFQGHTGTITDLAVSRDGRWLASASGWPQGDKTARVWNLETGEQVQSLQHLKPVESVTFSPDGLTVLTGREHDAARLFSRETGKEIARFKSGLGPVIDVAFFPDGKRIVTMCHVLNSSLSARIWDVATGKKLREISVGAYENDQSGRPGSLAMTPDGRYLLISGGWWTTVWDAETWTPIVKVRHERAVETVSVSPDGKQMLAATRPPFASVRLLRIEDGNEIRRFEAAAPAYRVEFLPTGKHFVTCSLGQVAKLCVWDIGNGQQVAAANLDDAYLSLGVVPDGRRIVGAGGMAWLHRAGTDLDVHLWQLPESVWATPSSTDD